MATTGIVNGTDLLIYVGGTAVAHATSHSLSLSMDTRDATTKDSEGWTDRLEGLRSWEISGNALFAFDAAYGFDDLFTVYTGRTAVTVKFSSEVSGDKYYSGSGYLTSLTLDAPTEDNASFAFTVQGNGTLTEYTGT